MKKQITGFPSIWLADFHSLEEFEEFDKRLHCKNGLVKILQKPSSKRANGNIMQATPSRGAQHVSQKQPTSANPAEQSCGRTARLSPRAVAELMG
jgi:hypothetical protein